MAEKLSCGEQVSWSEISCWAQKVLRKARINRPGASEHLRCSISLSLQLWLHETNSKSSPQDVSRTLEQLRRLVMAEDPGIGQIRARLLNLPPAPALTILRVAHRRWPALVQTAHHYTDLAVWTKSSPAAELLAYLRAVLPMNETAEKRTPRCLTSGVCANETRLLAYFASDLAYVVRSEIHIVIEDDSFRDLIHHTFRKFTHRNAEAALRRFRASFKSSLRGAKRHDATERYPSISDRLAIRSECLRKQHCITNQLIEDYQNFFEDSRETEQATICRLHL